MGKKKTQNGQQNIIALVFLGEDIHDFAKETWKSPNRRQVGAWFHAKYPLDEGSMCNELGAVVHLVPRFSPRSPQGDRRVYVKKYSQVKQYDS